MKNTFLLLFLLLSLSAFSQKKGKPGKEKIIHLAGTWFENGDSSLPCYIVQNRQLLVFLSGNQTSTGYFKSSFEVFAKEWSANAILSTNAKTLTWNDRVWKKGTFTYPDISGVWYENGEASKKIVIIQKGINLKLDNGIKQLEAYFYTTNGIYSLDNNNYGTYSPLSNTINWGTKTWTRSVQ